MTLHISPFREDGVTYGTPTWIWSVAVDDALHVRGYNGQRSRWYQAAVRQRAGRIVAAAMTREVTFEPADGPGQVYGCWTAGAQIVANFLQLPKVVVFCFVLIWSRSQD